MEANNKVLLMVFPVENEEYAVPIEMVTEVIPAPPIAPIPQAPNYIKGASNVRGNVLAVLDPAIRFGLSTENVATETDSKFLLVINSEEYKVAIIVDSVPDNLMVSQDNIDESIDVISGSSVDKTYIKGIVKVDGRMIIMIDILKTIAGENLVAHD